MSSLSFAILVLLASADVQKPAAHPRAELLIEAGELAQPRTRAKFHVLDARGTGKYLEGRIPGAASVDVITWSKDFAKSQDPKVWSKRFSEALIDDLQKPVVVYADDVREAARVWWILRYWGVREVRLLNGGWDAWVAARGPIDKEPPTAVAAPELELKPAPERHATRDFVLDAIKNKSQQILDVRSRAEYCGETESAKRNGAIPGAVHLEWTEVLDPKTKRFKPPEELAKLFKDSGIDVNRPSTTYCQSGGRAAVMVFALELMGARDVRNYYRSWSEWGNADDTPIIKPKQ